jgi:hypothetical protein
MHTQTPTRSFQPFVIACSARNLTAQLDALKQHPAGRLPHPSDDAQDIDVTAPHYAKDLSKAGA